MPTALEPEPVRFYSEGVALAGDLYRPPDPGPGRRRVGVVLCHGYTGTRRVHLPDYARAIAGEGYVALTFDYKGWGESEGPRTRLAPYSRVADAAAALSFLSARPEVAPGQLGLFGTSYGGAVALWLAAVDPRVGAVVSSVGVGEGARWMRSVRRPDEYADLLERAAVDRIARALTGRSALAPRDEILLPDRNSARLGESRLRDNPAAVTQISLEFVDDTLGFNPEWVVDRIAPRPVLFITSDSDRLVPPAESRALYVRAGEPKRLVVLEGFGHYEVYEPEAARQVMAATLEWLARYLPPGGAPPV